MYQISGDTILEPSVHFFSLQKKAVKLKFMQVKTRKQIETFFLFFFSPFFFVRLDIYKSC